MKRKKRCADCSKIASNDNLVGFYRESTKAGEARLFFICRQCKKSLKKEIRGEEPPIVVTPIVATDQKTGEFTEIRRWYHAHIVHREKDMPHKTPIPDNIRAESDERWASWRAWQEAIRQARPKGSSDGE